MGTAWDHTLLQRDRSCMQAWAVNTLSKRRPRVHHSLQLISEDYLCRIRLLCCDMCPTCMIIPDENVWQNFYFTWHTSALFLHGSWQCASPTKVMNEHDILWPLLICKMSSWFLSFFLSTFCFILVFLFPFFDHFFPFPIYLNVFKFFTVWVSSVYRRVRFYSRDSLPR